MKKTLYVNGCSWTWGNGIEFDPRAKNHKENILDFVFNNRWSSLLSQKLDMNCINESQGAGSNKRMVRTTCEFLQKLNDNEYRNLFVILGWTTVDRNELFLDDGNKEHWALFNATQPVSAHRPPLNKMYLREIDRIQEDYNSYIFNSKANYVYFFQEMYLMSNLLENLGIKYIFFSALPWRRYATDETGRAEEIFKNQISKLKKPQILNTRDCDDKFNVMSDFCRLNNVPMAPDHHTMVEGHSMWANHLHSEILKIYGDSV